MTPFKNAASVERGCGKFSIKVYRREDLASLCVQSFCAYNLATFYGKSELQRNGLENFYAHPYYCFSMFVGEEVMCDSRLKKMIVTTKLTYRKLPFPFRELFCPIEFVYRCMSRFARKLRINLWIISGEEPPETDFSIIYAGHEKHKNYIADLAFGNSYAETPIGTTWIWNLDRMITKNPHDCSLMILEVNKVFCRLIDSKKMFFIPIWVDGEVDIPVDMSSFVKANSSVRSDVRRIKKNNLQVEVTSEQRQFDDFYNNMYIPHITRVHGNRSVLMTYHEMKKNTKNCELLLIKKDKEYVAGLLIRYDSKKNIPRLWQLGIKDGNPDYVKAGAMGALYYYAMKYLKEKGYKKVNYYLSRAFLKDGVIQYKKKWGLKIASSTKKGFLVKPLSNTNGIKRFFSRNPFIYGDKDQFNSAIFLESNQLCSEKDFEQFYKKFCFKGLHQFVVYVFGDNIETIETFIPTEVSDSVSIRSAEMVF